MGVNFLGWINYHRMALHCLELDVLGCESPLTSRFPLTLRAIENLLVAGVPLGRVDKIQSGNQSLKFADSQLSSLQGTQSRTHQPTVISKQRKWK